MKELFSKLTTAVLAAIMAVSALPMAVYAEERETAFEDVPVVMTNDIYPMPSEEDFTDIELPELVISDAETMDWSTWDTIETDEKTSTVTTDTSTFHGDSKYSVKITSTEYNRVFVEKKVKVKPGVKYYMSAYIKVVGFSGITKDSTWEQFGGGAFIGNPWYVPAMTPVTNDQWTRCDWTYTAKEDETEHNVALMFGNSTIYCKGTAYFSDFTFGEYDDTKWHKGYSNANGVFSTDKNVVYNNEPYSLKIENKEYGYSYVQKTFKVKPETHYKFSTYVKYTDFVPENSERITGAFIILSAPEAACTIKSHAYSEQKWGLVSLDFWTGKGQTSADIQLFNGSNINQRECKGTAYFSNIRLEEVTETTNEWNILVVCFRNADVNIIKNGKNTNYKVSFEDSVINGLNKLLGNLKKDYNTTFGDLVSIKEVDFKVSDVPIRKMGTDGFLGNNGDPKYSPDFTDPEVVKEVNGFLKAKQYQHLIFITPLHGEGTNSGMNGLANIDFNYGVPTVQVMFTPQYTNLDADINRKLPTRLFIHETLHTSELDTMLLTGSNEVYGLTDKWVDYGYTETDFYKAVAQAKVNGSLGIDPRAYYRPTGRYVLVSDDMTPGAGIEVTGTLPTHISTLNISGPEDRVYKDHDDKPVVTVAGAVNGTDYTVSYGYDDDSGIGKVIIKGIGKYTGSVEKTFRFTPPTPQSNVVAKFSGKTWLYNDLTTLAKSKYYKNASGAVEITINTDFTTPQVFTLPSKATAVTLKGDNMHTLTLKAATLTSKGSLTVENLTLTTGKKEVGLTAKTTLTVKDSVVGALKAAGEMILTGAQIKGDVSMTAKNCSITLSSSTAYKKVTSSGSITLTTGSSIVGAVRANGVLTLSAGTTVKGAANVGGISIAA